MKKKTEILLASALALLTAGGITTGVCLAINSKPPVEDNIPVEPNTPTPDDPSGGEEQPLTQTITFEIEGQEPVVQSVATGSHIEPPTAPTREGYIFQGWALQGTTDIVDFSTFTATENMTFVAIWEKEPVKVTSASLFTFDGSTLTGYVGEETDIVIPSTYSLDAEGNPIDGEDISVTIIGSSAFANNLTIQKVIIQDGIIELMGSAFDGCKNLTEVSLPNTLKVMSFSIFSHTGLKSITIPASVESVNGYIFDNCTSLESVVLNEGLKSIPQSMFYCCSNLKNISIPESVTSIGNSAFVNCYNFTEIFIPKNVTSIGNSAFNGCKNVTSIIVDEENAVYNSNNNCNAIIETSTNTLIRGCNNTTIPDDIKAIGDYAFSQCEKISSITIPDSVISIGLSAFNACEGITTIIVGSGVTSIGDWCFNKNSGEVFKVIFRSPTPATIQDYTFGGNHWSAEIYAPDEAVDAYKEAWADCASQIKPVSEYTEA